MSSPQAKRAAEGEESEATNLRSPRGTLISQSNIFNSLKVNSSSKVFFGVIHPYKKDQKSFQTISKAYDWLRKFGEQIFIVKEKNTESSDSHYHFITVNNKVKDVQVPILRHNKLWIKLVDSGVSLPPHDPSDHSADIYDRIFDPYESDSPPTSEEVEIIRKAEVKQSFIEQYYSKEEQVKLMIKYMLKSNPQILYQDYIFRFKY